MRQKIIKFFKTQIQNMTHYNVQIEVREYPKFCKIFLSGTPVAVETIQDSFKHLFKMQLHESYLQIQDRVILIKFPIDHFIGELAGIFQLQLMLQTPQIRAWSMQRHIDQDAFYQMLLKIIKIRVLKPLTELI